MPNFNESPEERRLNPLPGDLNEPVSKAEANALIQAIIGLQRSLEGVKAVLRPYEPHDITDLDGRLYRVLARPTGITDALLDEGPLTLYRTGDDGIGVRWGLVNGIVPSNIDTVFAAPDETFFFIRATLSNPTSRLVTGASIITGASATTYPTPNFTDNQVPQFAYFLLGYASPEGITNAGRGNLEFHVITSHMFTDGGNLNVQYRIGIYRTG